MKDKRQIRPEDFESFKAFHDAAIKAGMTLDELHEVHDAYLEREAKKVDADLASPERKAVLDLANELDDASFPSDDS
ncbi:MAG: hypothetical protein JJ939_14005 [Alphaproteobacteria bacterium]|nr:hypothetical protein [Alphaproteobacteria bacterium]MBO6629528.1 hypothetical protein [Alphaproteobacteria bacterium]MDF1625797.1 hypothetical protein [Parvibaculaceae bacterium]|tara:strand:- start:244 stop:474 length:231 start_codon:yes stop_codon:yes gene_type:complete